MTDLQTDAEGRLRHLLSLEGLPRPELERLLERAQRLTADANGGTAQRGVLAGKAVCTLFFEPSTRTRSSFSLAARFRLPVVMVDERNSSQEAARRFAAERAEGRRKRRDAELLDAVAAAVIVERWLSSPGDAVAIG